MDSFLRILLTYIRTVKYVSKDLLEKQVNALNNFLETLVNAEDAINILNDSLSSYHFKIEKNMDEISGDMAFCFINTDNSPIYSQFTSFKEFEIQIVKHAIDLIFEHDYHYDIDKIINYIMRLSGRTYKEVYFVVSKMINTGWLVRVNNELLVSVRLKLELKSYLQKFDLVYCKICNNIITRGVALPNANLHYTCFDIYRRTNAVDTFQTIGLEVE